MKTLIGGGIAVAIGIIGVLVWWKSFFAILAGFIPVMLLLGGGLAIYLGFDELKDAWGKSDDKKDDDEYKSPIETPIAEVVTEPEKKTEPKKAKVTKKETETKKDMTAGDTILNIIAKSKEGVDTASLQKETGFTTKKIHNIVYKLKKQGKITSERKGFYKKA
jgi:phosphate/sulfate permease